MPCPKCGGMARCLDLMTTEGRLMVHSCINCGRVFGDAMIDYHQGLEQPPEPYEPVLHAVWYPKDTRSSL
jgi:hypothetical protein